MELNKNQISLDEAVQLVRQAPKQGSHGLLKRAAEMAGVSRTTLWSALKKANAPAAEVKNASGGTTNPHEDGIQPLRPDSTTSCPDHASDEAQSA